MEKTATTMSALDVAKYIISVFDDTDKQVDDNVSEGVSNLRLQKLLYFCQAFALVRRGEPLFSEKIYAWKYGPVVKEVYDMYSEYKNNPIPNKDEQSEISEENEKIIGEVLNIFGGYSAVRLMDITHSHRPWKDLEGKVSSGERDVEIKNESIKKYYEPILTND